jgi:hypothetical protein
MDGEGRDSGPDPLRVGGKVIDTKAGLYDILPVEEMRKQEGKRVPIRRNFTGPIIGYGTLTFNEEDGCIHIDAEGRHARASLHPCLALGDQRQPPRRVDGNP